MTLFRRLAWTATALTLIVVVVGAWVRLTDAGLGCPDWPGCYGMATWPQAAEHVDRANAEWGHLRPVESGKAFREMFHRYIAGLLGLVILALAILAWRNRHDPEQPVALPTILLGLVVFQAALGMWTVTMLLKPAIVTAHLVGGLATFSLLLWLSLRCSRRPHPPSLPARLQRWPIVVAGLVLIVQILLGGWVSTNYAALACTDFPTCQGQWWPETDFAEGFRVWRGVGVDYEGGILDQSARAAIHMAHRIWALVVIAVFAWLFMRLARAEDLVRPAIATGALLASQIVIGIVNVVGGLPLANAVAHNGVAALLLGAMIVLLDRSTLRPAERL
ncbi:MAG: COX15/CtaA family protein [Wenzhouxiangellaceae bacterium]|nr:COX15/CtaA family protein [Wenzhouxiangellaceae bacterium]